MPGLWLCTLVNKDFNCFELDGETEGDFTEYSGSNQDSSQVFFILVSRMLTQRVISIFPGQFLLLGHWTSQRFSKWFTLLVHVTKIHLIFQIKLLHNYQWPWELNHAKCSVAVCTKNPDPFFENHAELVLTSSAASPFWKFTLVCRSHTLRSLCMANTRGSFLQCVSLSMIIVRDREWNAGLQQNFSFVWKNLFPFCPVFWSYNSFFFFFETKNEWWWVWENENVLFHSRPRHNHAWRKIF